jgi:hypothetical protein
MSDDQLLNRIIKLESDSKTLLRQVEVTQEMIQRQQDQINRLQRSLLGIAKITELLTEI